MKCRFHPAFAVHRDVRQKQGRNLMTYNSIRFESKGPVGVLTLNRPESLNALTSAMLREVKKVLDTIETDSSVRALVLTGGKKVFAAGFDIKEISSLKTPEAAHGLLSDIHQCYNKLAVLKMPVIAAASGPTFGGGFELALACDIRIASETARFGLPEINLGLIPGAGGTQRLPRIVGIGRACEMLFSGMPVDAQKALSMGLVNHVVPPDELLDTAMEMAEMICTKPFFALNTLKEVVQTGMDLDMKSALAYEARCFEMLFSTPDQAEGVAAFIEKRRPCFK